MSTTYLAPCEVDSRPLSPAMQNVMTLLMDYDDLMELCYDSRVRLSPDQEKELNDMYAALALLEQSYWEGVPGEMVEQINFNLSFEFPMLRFLIGIVPTEDN